MKLGHQTEFRKQSPDVRDSAAIELPLQASVAKAQLRVQLVRDILGADE
jgi:hypothetical protein